MIIFMGLFSRLHNPLLFETIIIKSLFSRSSPRLVGKKNIWKFDFRYADKEEAKLLPKSSRKGFKKRRFDVTWRRPEKNVPRCQYMKDPRGNFCSLEDTLFSLSASRQPVNAVCILEVGKKQGEHAFHSLHIPSCSQISLSSEPAIYDKWMS